MDKPAMPAAERAAQAQGPVPQPGILDIKPYKGGQSSVPGVTKIYKLSSNENALGASPRAIEAVKRSAETLHLYPDGGCHALREALADQHGIEAERIVCGAGSDEVLTMITHAFVGPGQKAVQSEHAFLVYRLATMTAGAAMVSVPERDLTADPDAIARAADDPAVKLVFLANPNNPTGTRLSREQVWALHAKLRSDQVFIIDGAYSEYVPAEEDDGAIELARTAPNVAVTRTFSKVYGLPALRVGWTYVPSAMADVLNRFRGPFNVSQSAQDAALAALSDRDFLERSVDHNRRWNPYLAERLTALGFPTHGGDVNFVLTDFSELTLKVGEADAFLRERGIIARPVANYGLPHHLRITVGTDEANEALLSAFQDLAAY